MINPFADTNWNPDRAERRRFARTLAIGFALLLAALEFAAWRHYAAPKPQLSGIFITAILIGCGLWLWPTPARPFYVVWYFIACCLGIVISNLLVAAFFYLIISPIGLILRATGRDPLQKRWNKACPTYWRDAEKAIPAKRYFRQF